MTYEEIKWKTSGLFKTDPVKVYEELQTLDEITPDTVVELARNKDSVLHSMIDWNDKVAASKWRKQQARIILCNLVVEVREHEGEEPKQIRLLHKPDENKLYQEIGFFIQNESEYEKLLNQAKRDLDSFRVKYHVLNELKPVFEAINEL